MELQGKYKQAVEMVHWGIGLLNNEFTEHSEEDMKLLEPFKALKERCLPLFDQEDKDRLEKLRKEAYAEFD